MKSYQTYKPELGFQLLLIGPPFSGKTNAAMCFPDPYIFDADGKMQNAVQRLPAGKKFWYDSAYVDDAGKQVEPKLRWKHATECIKKACLDPLPKTIILDSLTSLSTFLIDHILAQPLAKGALEIAGERAMSQAEWNPFKMLMTKLLLMCKASGKYLVVCCHEQSETNDAGSTIKYNPSVPGALRESIAGMFSDVWRCECPIKPVKGVTPPRIEPHYQIRAKSMPLMTLGNSLGLPAEFELSWEDLSSRLEKITLKTTPVVESQPQTKLQEAAYAS